MDTVKNNQMQVKIKMPNATQNQHKNTMQMKMPDYFQPEELAKRLTAILHFIRQDAPLIHCITNPISINDCANILLAIGARPIMAEHPGEVSEITAIAKALALNLGNITDVRMDSMYLASQTAHRLGLPVVVDLVGISCSSLRLNYAKKLLAGPAPAVIKGNISELRALLGLPVTPGMGVEAGEKEMVTTENAPEYARLFRAEAKKYHTTLLATGPMDLAVSESAACTIANGTEALASITGTGCMANVLTGACLSALGAVSTVNALDATVTACLLLGAAAEKIHHIYTDCGPGSFHVHLMDAVRSLTAAKLSDCARITQL